MNIWFYVFMSYLIFQGLISLIGAVWSKNSRTTKRGSFLKRFILFIFYMIISPFWHILVLLTYSELVFKGVDKENEMY